MASPSHRLPALAGLAAFLAAGLPLPAPAQSSPAAAVGSFGRTRLALFAGGSFRHGPSFGARVTRDLAGPVALDLSYRFAPTRLSLQDSAASALVPVDLHQVSANALVYLCGARCELRPFLTAGADFNGFVPRANSSVSRQLPLYYQPGFNYGGGFEAVLHRRFALRFDLRHHLSRFPAAPGLPPQPRMHDVEFSAAAVLRFR